jgi:hypothetical protein
VHGVRLAASLAIAMRMAVAIAWSLVVACNVDPQLPTHELPPDRCDDQFENPLTLQSAVDNRRSPVIGVSSDGSIVELVWPEGFSATFRPLRVYDARGEVIAEGGQQPALIGDYSTAESRFYVCEVLSP